MNEFGLKGNMADEDFMIHVVNNLPKEYNVILDGLEQCLIKKLNHWQEKFKAKKKKKMKKKSS